MSITVIVLGVAALAGIVAFAVSASRAVVLDPTGSIERHPRLSRFVSERVDRQSWRGLLLTGAFAVVLVVALALGLLLDMVRTGSGLAELDDGVAEWGSHHASSTTVDVLQAITQLGSSLAVAAALAAAALVDWLRRRSVEVLVFVGVIGVGQYVLSNLLKLIVDRQRPDVLRLVEVSGPSFPSGHSTAAGACWAAVALVLARGRPRGTRALLAGGAVVVAVAVAASRALLGVHWLTDILAGLALGWGWFALVVLAFRTRAVSPPPNPRVSASPGRRRP